MDSASRLYERLGQIPQDPEDPESLEDMLVCAFGAFERYYVCWKNRGGEFRQDGYDLPPALQEWLFPTDGTSRDFPTLQVVFGRGDEYFASDKLGKLEFKEPEVKKLSPPEESLDKEEKPTLKRSRTISFLRPLSDSSTKSFDPLREAPTRDADRSRSSSISQPLARPQSTSLSTSTSEPLSRSHSPPTETSSSQGSSRRSSFISQPASRPPSISSSRSTSDSLSKPFSPALETSGRESPIESPHHTSTRLKRRSRPLSMSFNPNTFPKIVEGRTLSPATRTQDPYNSNNVTTIAASAHTPCTCGCHSQPPKPKPTYTDASMQTEPESPQRTALHIDTSSNFSSMPSYSNRSSALDIQTPLSEPEILIQKPNPVFMGRMLDYFSNPGYQLGDSLMSSYYYYQEQQQQQQQQVYYEGEGIYRDGWKEEDGVGQVV
ncbi:hypothetical protein B0J11DRAFT_168566 [Dendryphion nanum]|uniref:Uncharacterized protein n=1 Tax=Dendryphion nanum TaxID=256645 RepID=A0A9P9IXD7_9PLEO|nr:hypothetical protein B0J11DRAFT_168566 [Dendryphion nanum]